LIAAGNWFALAILAVLVMMSVVSWAIIAAKWMQLNRLAGENDYFGAQVQREPSLANLFAVSQKCALSPLARMFEQSYREISGFRAKTDKHPTPDARVRLMDVLSRTLERVYNQEIHRMEWRLPLLATVSSSAPYIGLFGTVLGIIKSFQDIGVAGVTSLAVVAPGIAESLVATAAGLMAAIPALIAYNMFRNRIRDVSADMKSFALDLTNRLEKLL
jgi:biopolymer transport protein TolQ